LARILITVPYLDLDDQTIAVSCWLVARGRAVIEGDRVVELVAGEVIVDLTAPASGRLIRRDAAEGDVVQTGQVLGLIEPEETDG
jgi:pyruvate/2-oxoglutarate dehydrogenase complex dihydrolipoamide acyltransferase (E2) component